MIRRPPRSTRVRSSAASDVYKRQESFLYNEINTHQMGWSQRLGKTLYGLYGKSTQRYHGLLRPLDHPLYNPWINAPSGDLYFPQYTALHGFLPTANRWSYIQNINLNLFIAQNYSGWGKSGSMRFDVRLPSPWSKSQYGFVQLEWKHYQPLGKTTLRLRSLAYYGGGNNPTPEAALYIHGANPEAVSYTHLTLPTKRIV